MPQLEEPTEQELLDYLNQEESSGESVRLGSSNSLFLKAMDGRPRRRRSFYARRRGSTGRASDPSTPTPPTVTQTAPNPAPLPANGRRGSLKHSSQPEVDTLAPPQSTIRRKSSAAEVLLSPIIQLVSQSQRAFEYLSSTPNQDESINEEEKLFNED